MMTFSNERASGIFTNVILLFIAILSLYSVSWALSGLVLLSSPPLWSVAIRLTASLFGVVVITFLTKTKHQFVWRNRLATVFLLSISGFSLFFTTTYLALRFITPGQLVLVLSLIPGITYLFDLLSGGRQWSILTIIGIAISVISICLFSSSQFDVKQTYTVYGLVLAALAAVSYSLYGIIYQRKFADVPVLAALPLLLIIATVSVALPATIFEGIPNTVSLIDFTYLIIIGSVLSAPIYILYNTLIKYHGAFTASLISVAAPLATFFIEELIGLRQTVSWIDFATICCGAVGVILVLKNR